jgi:hypothetical protein
MKLADIFRQYYSGWMPSVLRGSVENSEDQQDNIHGCQVTRLLQGKDTDIVIVYSPGIFSIPI